MASPRPVPPATIESLCRGLQQQILLLIEVQAPREVISTPCVWLDTWYHDLELMLQLLAQERRR